MSHDSMSARRWPWVTLSFIALCVVVHVALPTARREMELTQIAQRALDFHEQHPDLVAKAPLAQLERDIGSHAGVPEFGAASPTFRDPRIVRAEQDRLDSLTYELQIAMHALPSYAYGYVPAHAKARSLITYQFLHAGWLHLIFNMWFLWLVGCYVEDAWGRVLFPLFYLVAGALSALAHHLAGPSSTVPLVGASGAIAGAMGAFFVRYMHAKIRFWYFVLLIFKPLYGSFKAPAYVMLPLWLGVQVWSALSGDSDGVAYFAHIGGFAFGAAVALGLRYSGHEQVLDEAIERQVGWQQDPRLLSAGEQIDRRSYDAALRTLDAVLRESPNMVEAHLERLRAAKGKGDAQLEEAAYAGAIRAQLANAPGSAVDLFYDAVRENRAGAVPREHVLRIGRHLAANGAPQRAADVFGALYSEGGIDAPALNALIAHGELALAAGDHGKAVGLFESAQQAPHPHPELDTLLQHKLRLARRMSLPPES